MRKTTLNTTVEIDSAHYLTNYDGKCAFLHGHRWKINIQISPCVDEDGIEVYNEKTGMIVDFKTIKEFFDIYDHALIKTATTSPKGVDVCTMSQDYDETRTILVPFNPTAENLAAWWIEELNEILKDQQCYVSKITVWETPNNSVIIEDSPNKG